jgi:hypothetical protein
MKSSGHCPKCACGKLYVIDGMRQPSHDSPNGIIPFNVTTFEVASADLGVAENNSYRAAVGTFETWVCSSCGLTELYAKDFARAFELALNLPRRVHVRVVESPTAGPFR